MDIRYHPPEAVRKLQVRLLEEGYLADDELATSIHLLLELRKPLLLEGEAGVGKTEVASALSGALGRELIRLQCYEGIDSSQAMWEWDYGRQIVAARAASTGQDDAPDLFSDEYLIERPLLAAIKSGSGAVLLIDELDRADDEFEAFLLEALSEFSVTIPEIGRIAASQPPAVVITSNRTRELHDALKRRCLYHWIDHPTVEREVEIVRLRAPDVPEALIRRLAIAVDKLRDMDLVKPPGVAETIDWSNAVMALSNDLGEEVAAITLGAVIKDQSDHEFVRPRLDELFGE
jgi:MoxR-like ATPase